MPINPAGDRFFPLERRKLDRRTNLSSNELIHPAAAAVCASFAAGIAAEAWGRYPAVTDTVRALAGRFAVDGERLALTPGSDSALRLIAAYQRMRTDGRGELILQDPNYPAFEQCAHLLGLPLRRVPVDPARPAAQAEELVRAARESSRALIAVSVPNGPVGGVLPDGRLDELAQLARERDHLLVLDTCYQVFDGPLEARAARAGGPVLVVQSLSKSHALAGARISVLVGDRALLDRLTPGPLEHAVSAPSLIAARLADERHEQFVEIWRQISDNRDAAARRLAEAGLRVLPSGGNFLTVGLGAAERAGLTVRRLSEAGYRIRDLSSLPALAGYVRFTIGDGHTTGRFLDVFEQALPDPARAAETTDATQTVTAGAAR